MGLSDDGRLFRIVDRVDPRRDSDDDCEESRTLSACHGNSDVRLRDSSDECIGDFASTEEAFCCPDFRVTTWALCIDPRFAKLIRGSWFAKVVVMSEVPPSTRIPSRRENIADRRTDFSGEPGPLALEPGADRGGS